MKKLFLLVLVSVFGFSTANCMKKNSGMHVNKKEMTKEEAAIIIQKHWRTKLAQKEAAKLWTKKFCHSVLDNVLEGNVNLEKIKSDLQNIPEQWRIEVICNCLQILVKNLHIKDLVPQEIFKDLFALFGILIKTHLNDYFYIFNTLKIELLTGEVNKELVDTLKSEMPDLIKILTTLGALLDKDRSQEEALFIENLKLLEPKITSLLNKASTPQIKEKAGMFKDIIESLQNLSLMGMRINSDILGTLGKSLGENIGSSIVNSFIGGRISPANNN